MTKAELEIKYKEALEKLEEQKHLASAIDAKDREITKLIEKHRSEVKIIQGNQKDYVDSIVAEYQNKIKMYQETIKNLEQSIIDTQADTSDKLTKTYEGRIKSLETENNRRIKELDKILRVHGSLLKTLQGTIENAIELNEFIFNEITGGK